MEEFEKAFFSRPIGSFFGTGALSQFRTDVTDEGDHYLLEADLPGFEKKDITLDIRDDTLTVRAERKSKVEEKTRRTRSSAWSAPTALTREALISPVWMPTRSRRSMWTACSA